MPEKATGSEQVKNIPLSELHPFKNRPFKIKDDEAMMETADSFRQYGVLVPVIARAREGGGYELITGHRRHRASELAEKDTMPVIIRDLDDDAATIIMVDSNLQREGLLPSERSFAYKMKLDAMFKVAASKVFPHNLRHLFARSFYRAYRDVVKLADVLGHSSIETTRIYLVSTGAEHAQQMARLGIVL